MCYRQARGWLDFVSINLTPTHSPGKLARNSQSPMLAENLWGDVVFTMSEFSPIGFHHHERFVSVFMTIIHTVLNKQTVVASVEPNNFSLKQIFKKEIKLTK